jgi:DeoR family transcriptional regulator of aga operon
MLIDERLSVDSIRSKHLGRAVASTLAPVRKAERFGRILELLAGDGSVAVGDLARDLAVSEATIRRDLRALDEQRLLARAHGGAVAHGTLYELPVRYRTGRMRDEKHRIARAARERVPDRGVVALTGGTTTTEVARAIADREGLTIVTNALNIAAELAVRSNLKLIVTGGVARSASYELIGPLAEAALEGLNVDVAFIGVDGLDAEAGLTTHHEMEAAVNHALIARARRAIVVADASKLGRRALARICVLGEVDELITDAAADGGHLAALEAAGLAVTTVA